MKNEMKLGDICHLITDGTHHTPSYTSAGIPFLRVTDITGSNDSKKFISIDEHYELIKRCNPQKGDILYTKNGTIGVAKIIDWDYEFSIFVSLCLLKVNHELVDIKYLEHYLNTRFALQQALRHSKKATISNLHLVEIKKIKIPLPPLKTQKKIAAILDAADQYRQQTKALIEKYDQLAQSLFLDMFGDPVVNPKGWKKEKMENLMTIVRGGSPRPIDKFLGGTYPWIKIGDGTRGNDIYLENTKEHITEDGLSKTRLLPSGSLIFANCGVSLGFARIITFEGCIHDGWLAFSNINEQVLNKIFVLKTLNSITRYFRETAPDGTQPNLNTSIMKNFKFICPPAALQNKFAEELQLIEQQKQQAQASLQRAEDLFNSLLQQAFLPAGRQGKGELE